ncbi:hypothetical protein MTO96_039685 [Rhipicephalus appendiculatus]
MSSNASKSGSKSHSSDRGDAASKSEKSRTKPDSSDRNKHKCHKDRETHSYKYCSKEGRKRTEPPDKS